MLSRLKYMQLSHECLSVVLLTSELLLQVCEGVTREARYCIYS